MKYLLFTTCILLLASCTPSMHYTYKTEMVRPVASDNLIYENDTLRIKFVLQPKFILLRIDNKLNEGIKINWDEVSFSINGNTHRIVHKETGTMKIYDAQFTTSIPPHSYLKDGMIPVDKLVYTGAAKSGLALPEVKPSFPDYDYGNKKTAKQIQKLNGAVISIYLPMYIGNKFVNGSYELKVVSITPYKGFKKEEKIDL